MEYIIIFLIIC